MITIYPLAKIIDEDNIKFGDPIIIDDFVFIGRHRTARIGSYVHIASFSSITGGGDLEIGDFVGIASGSRIMTGSDSPYGLFGPTIPDEFRDVKRGFVKISDHVFVGVGSIIFPDVTIGEGAVIGAGSIVRHDLDPWGVYMGIPAVKVKERDGERVTEMKKRFLSW